MGVMATSTDTSTRPTVLIVDDDPATTDTFTRMLELSGYRAVCAYSGEDGLRQATHARPDVLILDLRMPLMDGADLLTRLRAVASLRDVPAVVVTGDYFIDEDTVERLRALGAWIRFKPLWLDDVVKLADELRCVGAAAYAPRAHDPQPAEWRSSISCSASSQSSMSCPGSLPRSS
jgi:CheY-like chemotaxis protein